MAARILNKDEPQAKSEFSMRRAMTLGEAERERRLRLVEGPARLKKGL